MVHRFDMPGNEESGALPTSVLDQIAAIPANDELKELQVSQASDVTRTCGYYELGE